MKFVLQLMHCALFSHSINTFKTLVCYHYLNSGSLYLHGKNSYHIKSLFELVGVRVGGGGSPGSSTTPSFFI
jgi:hypothetical protein